VDLWLRALNFTCQLSIIVQEFQSVLTVYRYVTNILVGISHSRTKFHAGYAIDMWGRVFVSSLYFRTASIDVCVVFNFSILRAGVRLLCNTLSKLTVWLPSFGVVLEHLIYVRICD
jgi:hypothetical protein